MGSTRLPGKVLMNLGGTPVLGWVVAAAQRAGNVRETVVATTTEREDYAIVDYCKQLGVRCFRGAREDVLQRFLMVADELDDDVARLTADCPLVDPRLIAMAVQRFEAGGVDYVSTEPPETLPRGMDVEVIRSDIMRIAGARARGTDRTHVTSYIWRRPTEFRCSTLSFTPPAADLRVTLDTPEDASALEQVVAELGAGPYPWESVVDLLRGRPDIVAINASVRQKDLEER